MSNEELKIVDIGTCDFGIAEFKIWKFWVKKIRIAFLGILV